MTHAERARDVSHLHAGEFLLHLSIFLSHLFVLFLHFCKTTAQTRENRVALQQLVLDVLHLRIQMFV